MTDGLDRTPRTEEERRRLAETQAQLDAVTARLRAEGIEVEAFAGFQRTDQETVDDIAKNDAAIFAKARAFTWEKIKGTALPVLPCAEIDGLDWLRRAVVAGRVTCRYFGIANELHAEDGTPLPMPLSVVFRLVTLGQETPLYVSVEDAPERWKRDAMHRVVVAWPPLPDGRRPFIATGPMRQFETPLVVKPGKIGRNDPCPCGSGKKAKRCCLG